MPYFSAIARIFSFTFLALAFFLSFHDEVRAAGPSYRASGTFTAKNVDITPPYPANMAADDVCLLAVESENQTISLSSAQGFAEVPWSPQSAGSVNTDPGTRLAVFWKRTVGGDTAPTVADSGDHTTGQIHCFSNVIPSGDPWDTGAGGNDLGANDTTGTIPGSTTTSIDTLVVLIISTSVNATSAAECSGWTNADLASITERTDNTHTQGKGGGHCMATGVKTSAGTYATTTLTLANTTYKGAISIALKPVPATTLATGSDPATVTIAPGASATDANQFTLQTNTGTETLSSVTVNLSTASGVERLAITTSGDTELGFTTSPATGSNVIPVSGMSAGTDTTTFKVRVTPLSHTAMSVPPGGSYAITAPVTAWAGTGGYAHAGSDADFAALTIDNASPANATSVSGSAGNAEVIIIWTNPADSDLHSTVVLRRASSAIADTPTEGTIYTVGNTIGTATVACVVASPTATCTDSSLTNGTAYHYKVFPRDNSVNYATGVVPIGSPFTPSLSTFTITATAGTNGSIFPSGAVNVAQGSDQTFTITPDTGYNIDTLVVDNISIATSTSYTFTNVQTSHTIETTFIAIPAPPGSFSIAATAGTGGTISPSGLITVTQGNSQSFTITPDEGNNIATLVIDSVSIATSTSYTFTNVQANHTIEATFATPSATTGARIARPITVTFSGKALPYGKISIVDRELESGRMTSRDLTTGSTGSFLISFVDIIQGIHTFGILAKDKEGRSSQSKFYTLKVAAHELVEKDILLPPTIDLMRGQISRGKNATIIGFASPENTIRIEIDDILVKETSLERDGSYRVDIPTGTLEFGTHKVRVRQYDRTTAKTSDYSPFRPLIVSRLAVAEADFSGDGKIDIQDWSIFLSRWGSKDALMRQSIDLSGDGKITISDFSIFIKTLRRK